MIAKPLQTFSPESLRHTHEVAASGDEVDADTVCVMAADLIRAHEIEQAAIELVRTIGSHEDPLIQRLKSALMTPAPVLGDD